MYKTNYFFVYLIFIFLIFILSIYFSYNVAIKFPYLIDDKNNIVLSKMMFGYGELIDNIFYHNEYIQIYNNTESYLIRLPFLPIVTTLIGKISLNIYFFIIIKNFIFFSIYFFSAYLLAKNYFKKNQMLVLIFLLSIYFYNIYNTIVSLNFFYADSYISIILPSLFLLLISNDKNRYILISILIFCLYLSKTSMFFVSFICPFVYYFLEKKLNFFKRILPILFLLFAIVLWGNFGLIKSGKFPFGSNLSSSNQEGLSRILNYEFRNYYPNKSVDLIPFNKIKSEYENEWDFFEQYKRNNLDFIKNNLGEVFYGVIIKTKFILFNYKKDGVFPDEYGNYENPFILSHLLNRILGLFFLTIIIRKIFVSFKIKSLNKSDIYVISLYLPFLFPYVVGWATSKHLVPIFLVINIYLVIKIFNKYLKSNF